MGTNESNTKKENTDKNKNNTPIKDKNVYYEVKNNESFSIKKTFIQKHEGQTEQNNAFNENIPSKLKKIDEKTKVKIDIYQLSSTGIKRHINHLEKELEESKKELDKRIKSELIKDTDKYIIMNKGIYNPQKNIDKEMDTKITKVVDDYYRENENTLGPLLNSMNEKDYKTVLNYVEDLKDKNIKEFKTQIIKNNSYNIPQSKTINLDENKEEDVPKKEFSKSNNKIEENNIQHVGNKVINNNAKILKCYKITSEENIPNPEKMENKTVKMPVVDDKTTKNNITEINLNYSFKCLTKNLNFKMQKGIAELKFKIDLENNGTMPWPQGKTFLETNYSKSMIKIEKNVLNSLNPGSKCTNIILFKGMNKLKPGRYYSCLDFKVDEKKYGDSILVNVEVTENMNKIKYGPFIPHFRDCYGFDESMVSDTFIANKLDEYKNYEQPANEILAIKN